MHSPLSFFRFGLLFALCLVGSEALPSAKVDRIRGCNSNVLSVLTWNILAPIWVNRTQLKATGVDINLLNDDVRLKIALHEIKRAEPDIVNLQEVQEDVFPTIKAALSKEYIASAFSPHKVGYWSSFLPAGKKYVKNGVATFYKKCLFKLLKVARFPTNTAGNMALATVLELRFSPFKCAKPANRGSPVVMVNCHLEVGATPAASGMRVKQGSAVMKKIDELSKSYKKKPLVFIVGDINTMNPYPGFTNFKKNGYLDVVEDRGGNASYTYYYPAPVTAPGIGRVTSVALDHIFYKASNKIANRIKIIDAGSPSINWPELNKSTYFSEVKCILEEEMDAKKISNSEDAVDYLLNSKTFSTLFKLKHEILKTDNNANRVLRLGSDHFPVFAEFQI